MASLSRSWQARWGAAASTITIKFLGPRNDLVTALVHLYLLIMPIFLKNIPQYFDQVAAPFPDEMVEEIHRGGGGGGQEDGAAGEEDDENNEPLPSEDAGESVHNDHSYCVFK